MRSTAEARQRFLGTAIAVLIGLALSGSQAGCTRSTKKRNVIQLSNPPSFALTKVTVDGKEVSNGILEKSVEIELEQETDLNLIKAFVLTPDGWTEEGIQIKKPLGEDYRSRTFCYISFDQGGPPSTALFIDNVERPATTFGCGQISFPIPTNWSGKRSLYLPNGPDSSTFAWGTNKWRVCGRRERTKMASRLGRQLGCWTRLVKRRMSTD